MLVPGGTGWVGGVEIVFMCWSEKSLVLAEE